MALIDGLEYVIFLRSIILKTSGMACELDKIARTDHKNLFDTVHSTVSTTKKTALLHVGKKQLLGQKGFLIQSNMQKKVLFFIRTIL